MKIECRLSCFKTGNQCPRPTKGSVCLAKRSTTGTAYQIVFESKMSSMKLPIQADSRLRILKEHAGAGKVTFISTDFTYCVSGANVSLIRRLLQDISKVMRGEQVSIDSNKQVKKPPSASSRVSLVGNEKAAQFFASGSNPNLKELTLSRCTFKKIRPELFAAKSLHSLSLTDCTFEPELDMVDSFFSKFSLLNRLSFLTSLNLSGSEIPPQHIYIPKTVMSINLSFNKLINYLPRSVYDHPFLKVLDLKGCSIKFLNSKISNLRSLRFFDLSHNPLTYLPGSIASLRLDTFNSSSCPFEVDIQLCTKENAPPTLESIAWASVRNLSHVRMKKEKNDVSFSTLVKLNNWHRFIPPSVLISGECTVGQCHTCGIHFPLTGMVSKMKYVSPLSFSNYTDSGFVPLKYDLCNRCSEFC